MRIIYPVLRATNNFIHSFPSSKISLQFDEPNLENVGERKRKIPDYLTGLFALNSKYFESFRFRCSQRSW